ncbi:hypothetical protein NDI85_16335 [Halomicroarcula sp. S1AR25-4]|uniref:hypothetical protein n=1 Tax=Haloarcula sp. S1AR25-4 TaxID=2950538 RepID=UPI0028754272|nr:hypothetical protein [Halomicroarcula sp. S1AR25-4]MDS0279370.1 hypothetical protein [Halomicroarcula sp. S1AR25-4]
MADGLAQVLSEGFLTSGDSIEVHSTRREVSDLNSSCPFNQQEKIVGEFRYHFKGRKGYSPSRDLQFEYRCESNLFVLSSNSTPPELEDVISEMNEGLHNSNRITRIRSANRQSVMQLFENAHQIKSVTFSKETGDSTLSEIQLKSAETIGESGQSFEAVSGDFSHALDLKNSPVRSIEGIFREGDQFVSLKYEKGKIAVKHPQSELGEFDFLIHLIESYLI